MSDKHPTRSDTSSSSLPVQPLTAPATSLSASNTRGSERTGERSYPHSSAESLLDRYVRKPGDGTQSGGNSADTGADTEGAEDLGCFGFLRGIRDRALMLELRKKDGSVTAIAYAYIERITYSPDPPHDGITIHAAGQTIRITGRNLNVENDSGVRLFGALARHRVPWIAESLAETSHLADEKLPQVERIGE